MSILLVDIGNTRIKWARLTSRRLGPQHAAAHAGWDAGELERRLFKSARGIERVVVASVAAKGLERDLLQAARECCRVTPEFIKTQHTAAGVTTRYHEPWRLGVDRFVGCIGAHHLLPRRAVCVVDVGTAMTIDLVDAGGVHWGGVILPGPHLMVASLLKDTAGIERRARGAGGPNVFFARNTRAAIQHGTRHAAAAIVDRAVGEARRTLKSAPGLLVTGGSACAISKLIATPHRLVPDLVLQGLAALV